MKYTLLFVLFVMFGSHLCAQEEAKPLKINKQWEIGADIRWVWRDYNEGTLFFRKNFTKGKKKMAHRYAFNLSKSHYHSSRSINSSLVLGKEWQYSKHKFIIFYGIDFPISWYHSYDTDNLIESSDIIHIGTLPFLGAKYPITKGISVSWSTGFHLRYRYGSGEEQATHLVYSSTLPSYRVLLSFQI